MNNIIAEGELRPLFCKADEPFCEHLAEPFAQPSVVKQLSS